MPAPLDVPRIAQLEESRLAVALAEIAPESRPWLGGVICRGEPGLWYNSAYGTGLADDPTDDDIAEMIAFFEERNIEPRLELCALARGAMLSALAKAGFILRSVEEVLACPLDRPPEPARPDPPGLTIEIVDPADPAQVDAFADQTMRGFLPPGTTATGEMVDIWKDIVRHPRVRSFVARIDGERAGVASVELHDQVACLIGATTLEPFRGRGVQSALIARRLAAAREHGATVATIGSKPGHHTARNAMRHGFQIAYAKMVLARPGEGLTPVMG